MVNDVPSPGGQARLPDGMPLRPSPLPSVAASALPVGFAVIGVGDVVTVWNTMAARLLNTAAETAVGHRFADLEVSYRVPGLRAAVEQVKATGAPLLLEDVVVPDPDGPQHVAISIRPALNATRSRAIMLYVTDMNAVFRLREELDHIVREHALEIGHAQVAQEALAVTVEELAASNHELQVSNE